MLAGTNLLSETADTAKGALLERTLGRTGLELPIVSMGVMNADVPGILRRSYELGIRHFDTAAVYQNGRNEEMVGSVVKELGIRDKFVISTKQGIRASVQNPVDAKKRFIGISTHNTVEVLNAVVPLNVFDVALVTLNYTMAHDAEMLATIEKAAKSNIGIVAMKTQAGGTVRLDAKLPKELLPESQTALLKWVLNHYFITTAIPGFSTYEHLEQDFTVVRNLAYTDAEKKFLADKTFSAQAEFCQQCGQCREDCPKRVDIPALMRSHMYAVQYSNVSMARHLLAKSEAGQGIDACRACHSCKAHCRNTVHIARKISQLKELQLA
jgi:hypothetical protein